MIDPIVYGNAKILHFKNAIPKDLATHLKNLIEIKAKEHNATRIQTICKKPVKGPIKDILTKIKNIVERLTNESLDFSNCHTITKHLPGTQIKWHYDVRTNNEKYKIVIYLGDSLASTTFKIDDDTLFTPQIDICDVVVFDINLYHCGQKNEEFKYLLGTKLVPSCN